MIKSQEKIAKIKIYMKYTFFLKKPLIRKKQYPVLSSWNLNPKIRAERIRIQRMQFTKNEMGPNQMHLKLVKSTQLNQEYLS